MPQCSIVMPTYQSVGFIGQAIHSVLAQAEEDWELIIGDNASTDRTADVVQAYHDPRIRYLRRPENLGYVGNVRQLLYEEAKGKYAVILCADDVWHRDYLRHALRLFRHASDVSLVHTGFRLSDAKGRELGVHVMTDCESVMNGQAFHQRFFFGGGMLIALSSALFRLELARRAQAFQQNVFHTDTALWLKLAWLGKVGYCPEPLVTYRWHPASLSQTTSRARRLEEWMDALDDLFVFAKAQQIPVDPAWRRAVRSSTMVWCLKDAPNVKIATGSNRDVIKLLQRVARTHPGLLVHPMLLARVLFALGAPAKTLMRMRSWHERLSPTPGFQLPYESIETHASHVSA